MAWLECTVRWALTDVVITSRYAAMPPSMTNSWTSAMSGCSSRRNSSALTRKAAKSDSSTCSVSLNTKSRTNEESSSRERMTNSAKYAIVSLVQLLWPLYEFAPVIALQIVTLGEDKALGRADLLA